MVLGALGVEAIVCPRGSQPSVCAALPGPRGTHKCPAAALSTSPRRVLLLQEVAGTHSGCKAANKIFHWHAQIPSSRI